MENIDLKSTRITCLFITYRHSFSVHKPRAGVTTSSSVEVRQLSHLSRERVLGHSLPALNATSHHVGGSEVNPAGVPTDSYIVNLIFIFTRTVMLQARDTLPCSIRQGEVC